MLEMTTTHLHTSWKTTACVEHPAREGVQNRHHWSRRPKTLHQNWVDQAGSRRHCCSCASVASKSFSLCESGWWSFWALLLILTFKQL